MQDGSSDPSLGAGRVDGENTSGAAPHQSAANRVDLLVGKGNGNGHVPEVGPDGDSAWAEAVNSATVDFFEYHLVTNMPGNDSGNRDRTSPDLDRGDGAIVSAPMFARRPSGGFNLGDGDLIYALSANSRP